MADYVFKTPTVREGPAGKHRLFYFYKLDRGISIAKSGGVYSLTQYPAQDDLETYTAHYMGGVIHTGISEDIRTAMIAANIGITSGNFTVE